MRIALFGASGATGRLLTERLLTRGHTITALLRTPSKFPFRDRIQIIEGSAFETDAVAHTIAGSDAVLSALGAHSPLRNENVLPRAIPLIVEAMQHAGVRRIIALGSAGAREDSLAKQPALARWIAKNIVYKFFLKWPVYEQVEQYRLLSKSSLDWTMPLPSRLTNGPARGHYRIDGEALPRNGLQISRADVADFMVQQLDSTQWLRRGVYLSY
ncbi:MAG TPA: NAD(P)H-binding protein [Edaphobacter sp.]